MKGARVSAQGEWASHGAWAGPWKNLTHVEPLGQCQQTHMFYFTIEQVLPWWLKSKVEEHVERPPSDHRYGTDNRIDDSVNLLSISCQSRKKQYLGCLVNRDSLKIITPNEKTCEGMKVWITLDPDVKPAVSHFNDCPPSANLTDQCANQLLTNGFRNSWTLVLPFPEAMALIAIGMTWFSEDS